MRYWATAGETKPKKAERERISAAIAGMGLKRKIFHNR